MTPEDRERIIAELGHALYGAKAEWVTTEQELAQGVRQAWDAFDKAGGRPTAADLSLGAILRWLGSTPEQVELYAADAVRLRRA